MKAMSCICGLQPDDVVQEVAAAANQNSDVGWWKSLWSCFLQRDMFADISKDEKLIQIHSTAEQLDATTEGLFHQMVVRSHQLS